MSAYRLCALAVSSLLGFFTWYLYATNGNARTVVYVLSLALLVVVPADIIRLNSNRFEWLFERVMGFLMRESEKVRACFRVSPRQVVS